MTVLNDRLQTSAQQWKNVPSHELVEYILMRFHQRHREQLPELQQLALRVEQAHGDHINVPNGLSKHLNLMQQELESHMQKEEQILFPMLSRGIYPTGPISVMEEEHIQHEDEINKINQLTNNLILPNDACGTWTALYKGLKELQDDLREHIHIENTVLFVDQKTIEQNSTSSHGEDFCCGSCQ